MWLDYSTQKYFWARRRFNYLCLLQLNRGPGSSVGIATEYGLEGPGERLVHLPSRASEESVMTTKHKGQGTTSSNGRSVK